MLPTGSAGGSVVKDIDDVKRIFACGEVDSSVPRVTVVKVKVIVTEDNERDAVFYRVSETSQYDTRIGCFGRYGTLERHDM